MENDLISALGGSRAVSAFLSDVFNEDVKQTAVCNWRHGGVPWRYRPAVASLAKAMNIALPDKFLPGTGPGSRPWNGSDAAA